MAITEDFLLFNFFDDRAFSAGWRPTCWPRSVRVQGWKFDLVRSNSVAQLTDMIKQGDADLTPAFTPSNSRENTLRFTKPYLTTPFVLVTPVKPGSALTLDMLEGKRVALVIDNTTHPYLKQYFPGVKLIAATNSAQALAMVARGEVEGQSTH